MSEDAPQQPTTEQLLSAGLLIGLDFTEAECEAMAARVGARAGHFAKLREGPFALLANHDAPPLYFDPHLPGNTAPASVERNYNFDDAPAPERPADLESLAFWPISQLALLLRSRQVSSLELTKMYLVRLRRFGPRLECVVTLAEALALEQARRADAELARGIWRGPLHGIPWGAKDLLATKGLPHNLGRDSLARADR